MLDRHISLIVPRFYAAAFCGFHLRSGGDDPSATCQGANERCGADRVHRAARFPTTSSSSVGAAGPRPVLHISGCDQASGMRSRDDRASVGTSGVAISLMTGKNRSQELDLVHYTSSMTRTINVHEAKTHLSRLLDDVAAGEEIVLAKAGRPFARLVPLQTPRKRRLGFVDGSVSDAFFEPLSEDELATWE